MVGLTVSGSTGGVVTTESQLKSTIEQKIKTTQTTNNLFILPPFGFVNDLCADCIGY